MSRSRPCHPASRTAAVNDGADDACEVIAGAAPNEAFSACRVGTTVPLAWSSLRRKGAIFFKSSLVSYIAKPPPPQSKGLYISHRPTASPAFTKGADPMEILRQIGRHSTNCEVLSRSGRLAKQGKTLVVVTHDFRAASHADRVFALRNGRIRGETRLTDVVDPQLKLSQLLSAEL